MREPRLIEANGRPIGLDLPHMTTLIARADAPKEGAATVVCGHCGGSGRVELTGIYFETLVLLRQQPGEVTGASLARLCGCKATAMSNRLAALERLGLATSRRFGRQRLYRAAEGCK